MYLKYISICSLVVGLIPSFNQLQKRTFSVCNNITQSEIIALLKYQYITIIKVHIESVKHRINKYRMIKNNSINIIMFVKSIKHFKLKVINEITVNKQGAFPRNSE